MRYADVWPVPVRTLKARQFFTFSSVKRFHRWPLVDRLLIVVYTNAWIQSIIRERHSALGKHWHTMHLLYVLSLGNHYCLWSSRHQIGHSSYKAGKNMT